MISADNSGAIYNNHRLQQRLSPDALAKIAELDQGFEYYEEHDRIWHHCADHPQDFDDLGGVEIKPQTFRLRHNHRVEVEGRAVWAGSLWLAMRSERHAQTFDLQSFRTTAEEAAIHAMWDTPVAKEAVRLATEKQHRAEKYRPLSVESLMERRPATWLVRGVLPATGLAVLYGQSSAGKTFLATDGALSIARGVPWLGARTKPALVVYVGLEGRMAPRIAAYCERYDVSTDDLHRFRVLERAPINLVDRDPQRIQDLVEGIRQATADDDEPVGLVVVDTLARAMAGGDENGGEDMGIALANAEAISKAFDCLTLLVHHSGKDASKGVRGHSSLHAAADAEIEVSRDGDHRGAKITKLRDGEDGRSFGFRLDVVDLGPTSAHDYDAGPEERDTSCVVVHQGQTDNKSSRNAGKPPRLGVHPTNAMEALRQAFVATPGSAFTDDAPFVIESVWREQFDQLYPVDPAIQGVDRKKEMDRRRAAFRDARSTLLAKSMILIDQVGGETRVRFA